MEDWQRNTVVFKKQQLVDNIAAYEQQLKALWGKIDRAKAKVRQLEQELG